MEKGLGKLTYHSNWPGTQQEGKKKKKALMVSSAPELGKTDLALFGEEERRHEGGDGMFQLTAELIAVMVEAETHRPGLL